MALNRVWVEQGLEYVDLEGDEMFKASMMAKGEYSIGYTKRGSKPTALRSFFDSKFNRKENSRYKGLGRKVSINIDSNGGRRIIANEPIEQSEIVAIGDAYVSVLNPTLLRYCVECCGEIKRGHKRCPDCGAFFCSERCKSGEYDMHWYTCNTTYQGLCFDRLYVKWAIQMVFKTLTIYRVKDAAALRVLSGIIRIELDNNNYFERNAIFPNVRDNQNDVWQEFKCMLHLYRTEYDDFGSDWWEAFNILMSYSRINDLCTDDACQYFLQHLLAHFLLIAHNNSFEVEVCGVKMCNVYHTLSFFNHSCSPNVLKLIVGGKMHCIAIRGIAQGEQLFIAYNDFAEEIPRDTRRQILRDSWNFECACIRCQAQNEVRTNEISHQKKQLKTAREVFMASMAGDAWNEVVGAQVIAYQLYVREAAQKYFAPKD